MSFGGFLDAGSAGARVVADIPYGSGAALTQPRLVAPSSLPKPMFSSPGLSLALQSNLEGGGGEVEMLRRFAEVGDFDAAAGGGGGRHTAERNTGGGQKEEEYDSRSGSENLDGGSGDDVDADHPRKKKRYHRHTPHQIQELEALFKECPHPDEKQRMELSKRLRLESRQIKFWFQNRQNNNLIMNQAQLERHQNALLKQENDRLKMENMAIRESMRNPLCPSCGGGAVLGEVSFEQQQLRLENARLRDELDRVAIIAERFLGRPLALPHSPLELAAAGNGFSGLGEYFLPVAGMERPPPPPPPPPPLERAMLQELAAAAMDELMKMYLRISSQCLGPKPPGYVTEASRETAVVIINAAVLVDTLMDAVSYSVDIFFLLRSLIRAVTATTDVVAAGDGGGGGGRSGALHLMRSELQVLSPLVPTREVSFLRFCKQHTEGLWTVVDVSVERTGDNPSSPPTCRRLPSGCLLQDMPNGYSKVTWVEHAENDDSAVHMLYRPLLRSGAGFGAQRWLGALQRQCECLAILMSSAGAAGDQTVISAAGRRSMVKLARRMTDNFCSGSARRRRTARLTPGSRREWCSAPPPPSGCRRTTAALRLPPGRGPPQRVGHPLQWRPMQEVAHIAKGQDHGNAVSLLRACAGGANQSSMLILQETCTDAAGSLVVYAPVDTPAMHLVMNGGDSSCVALLPSGFAIMPDGRADGQRRIGGAGEGPGGGGSLLTVAFQILVNSLPAAKLTVESAETVNNLISCTIKKIKAALHCDS
ncbi:unnamed protein product [Spirodela intermedia]|uniref:Uncharacterized protein n=1 Tax=Spirodela intermedia TaxID=51605 RepID=A0A7I8IZP6_SPIIN|nr:unnamed protein product [Spirodela intermedia]CAA6663357.1 unnamed protein product [Spirodela intermedia]